MNFNGTPVEPWTGHVPCSKAEDCLTLAADLRVASLAFCVQFLEGSDSGLPLGDTECVGSIALHRFGPVCALHHVTGDILTGQTVV
eukprot:CAMPEP_0202095154 /NCGR_PEP_ID=MMETSP0964-20121228/49401_1 /ASSEMBLY_ACC=CAM_ASM_000500 /TAXON_ID=4773 /ORGANISM="Schizochytrium aggregatum, Strain ATCC28209" /LENGTH=85 /DNA_ID=CAMNT_0048663409 /DNA_START=563 /DNA_END=817 /DNA_ORIENTATION=-